MDWDNRSLRMGALVLIIAVAIRLFGTSPLAARVQALDAEDLVSVILFLEAGRVVKADPEPTQTLPAEPIAAPAATVITDPQLPAVFQPEDLGLLEVNNLTGYEIDPEAMLQEKLRWDLTQEGPAVLILHTHATESYQNTTGYTETAQYRTLDTDHNVVSMGARLAQLLQEGGVQVLHDTTLHDEASYADAYSSSRQAVQTYLEQYPSIRLVLDIHRDAAQTASGEQIAYTSQLGGQEAAQLMIVSGSDAGGLTYPNWQENLSVAVKLQTALQRSAPGICRPLSFRAQRYNQDLHPAYLLVEVGAAGNEHQQALLAVDALARGILSIAHGTTWEA